MKLSIITINFRKPLLTLSCLESVFLTYKKYFKKNEWEFLIVDNNSEDNSIEILEKNIKKHGYKNVHLLKHSENNGFGGGNNYAAKSAKGEILLFLNNDTIVKKGLDNMFNFFDQNKNIGILGGPLKGNGVDQSSSGKFYTISRVILVFLGLQRFGLDKNPKNIEKVDWVKGALFMIRKNLFEKLNGFDEDIFMYTEDMEICYRAKKLDEEVWFYPDVDVIHKDQGSSNRSFAVVNIYKGIAYFYKKHKSIPEFLFIKFLLQTKALILIIYGKLTKNEYLISTYEKALNILG